jgi:adenylosuccinate lyase
MSTSRCTLQQAIAVKAGQWADVVKIGRTHLQDAVPLAVGQEWSGYAHQLAQAIERAGLLDHAGQGQPDPRAGRAGSQAAAAARPSSRAHI